MSVAKKVSELTRDDIAAYIRLPDASEDQLIECQTYLDVAKSYIMNYTGQEDLDAQDDFVIVVYVLCQDMYDNRTLYVEGNAGANKLVETILGMHSVNLL